MIEVEKEDLPTTVRFGDYELDLRRNVLLRKGVALKLQPQPMRALVYLINRAPEIVSREALADHIWGDTVHVEVEQSLNYCIRQIRQVLDDHPSDPKYVETLPRQGYRFISTVTEGSLVVTLPATLQSQSNGSQTVRHPDSPPVPGDLTPGDSRFVALERKSLTQLKASGAALRKDRFAIPSLKTPTLRWLLLAVIPVLAATVFLGIRHRRLHSEEPIRSLAALPFDDLSPGKEEEYFADGMTDELITELAHIPGLRVVSRTSVMQDKGSQKSLARIAQELGVDAIVEGSVVRSGDRVRIIAQLIDARSDKHLWAQSYEGPLGDILSLQGSVARDIALQTSAVLTPAARAELTNAKHIDPAAHDAYLRGLYFIQRRDGDMAASYFRQAIALEPEYAAANAGLAEALVTQTLNNPEHTAEIMPSAVAAAKRAVELDPDSGEAYTALGAIDTNYLLDWNAAEQNLRKGIALSPSSSDAESWFAVYLTSVGRPAEAVEAMKRAVGLDPLSFWANRLLGSMLYYSRRYDESLAALKRASELAPDRFKFVEGWNSGDYEMQGRYSDAFEADMKLLALDLSTDAMASFRSAFETGGWKRYQKDRVRFLLPVSRNDCYLNPLALAYVRLGNVTEAFRWLNRDVDNHCGTTVFDLSADPRLDKLRDDPRFTALLHRVNLPH